MYEISLTNRLGGKVSTKLRNLSYSYEYRDAAHMVGLGFVHFRSFSSQIRSQLYILIGTANFRITSSSSLIMTSNDQVFGPGVMAIILFSSGRIDINTSANLSCTSNDTVIRNNDREESGNGGSHSACVLIGVFSVYDFAAGFLRNFPIYISKSDLEIYVGFLGWNFYLGIFPYIVGNC